MSDTPYGLIPAQFERWFVKLLKPFAELLVRLKCTPNTITLISLGLGFVTGLMLALDKLTLALIFGIAMGFCDILDGQVAQISQRTGIFGAILDSVIDRYTDFMLLLGLGIKYYVDGEPFWAFISVLAIAASFEISYIRARAEGVGMKCNVGLAQRSERLILIGIGVIVGGVVLKIALLVLTVIAYYTAGQRLIFLKKSSIG